VVFVLSPRFFFIDRGGFGGGGASVAWNSWGSGSRESSERKGEYTERALCHLGYLVLILKSKLVGTIL